MSLNKKNISTFNNSIREDIIPGGKSSGKTVEDIAIHHNVTKDKIIQQIEKGIEVELEHTINKTVAREIAMDHLWEMPDYYDRLETIESTNENFKVKSLSEYLFEKKYISYSDYDRKQWGSPEDLKHDVMLTINNIVRIANDEVKDIQDLSSDKGIKFEIKLKNGDVIYAFKNNTYRGEYELYLNKKKVSKYDLQQHVLNKLNPVEVYLIQLRNHDFTYERSDDRRSYRAGKDSRDELINMYKELSNSDKKKAYKEYNKMFPQKERDFKNFKGV